MTSPTVNLRVLRTPLAVCRLSSGAPLPAAVDGELWSITRTAGELSVVCPEDHVPPGATTETGWRAMMVEGPLDFALIGILSAIAGPLASAGVSIFALSTYDTDYVLVKSDLLGQAVKVLRAAGHRVQAEG